MENFIDDKEKIVLFSGRLNPPTPAHVCTIIRLAKRFKAVKVVMLNYKEREFPIDYCFQPLREIFDEMDHDVEFITNTIHFGNITRQELDEFKCDIYAAGNLKVLRHVESLGFPVVYIERSFEYHASDYKRPE